LRLNKRLFLPGQVEGVVQRVEVVELVAEQVEEEGALAEVVAQEGELPLVLLLLLLLPAGHVGAEELKKSGNN